MSQHPLSGYTPQPIPRWLRTVMDPRRTPYPYGRTFVLHGSGFIPVDETVGADPAPVTTGGKEVSRGN